MMEGGPCRREDEVLLKLEPMCEPFCDSGRGNWVASG